MDNRISIKLVKNKLLEFNSVSFWCFPIFSTLNISFITVFSCDVRINMDRYGNIIKISNVRALVRVCQVFQIRAGKVLSIK